MRLVTSRIQDGVIGREAELAILIEWDTWAASTEAARTEGASLSLLDDALYAEMGAPAG